MSAQHMSSVAQRARLIGPALVLGGGLWIADDVLILINGALTGSLPGPDANSSLMLRIGLRLFVLSIPVLNVGLAALMAQTFRHSRKLSLAASMFMAIAIVLATVNTITLSGLLGPATFSDTFMGFSIFATAIATGLLGEAARRMRTVPRSITLPLLIVGIATIPLLFGTPLPFGPDWATDHLAFLTSGVAYVIAGARVWAARRTTDQRVLGSLNTADAR